MTVPKPHTISAVLINYNHSAYIAGALDSALSQTVAFDEIIIIDDCSTDESVAIISERINRFPHARLVRNPHNLGVIQTLNAGMMEASGDYIFFMSADDRYSSQVVEWYQSALAQYPDAAMISGNIRVYNADTGIERAFTLPFEQKVARYERADLERIAHKRSVTFYGGANLMRRDILTAANGHLEPLEWHADWFLYLLIACRYPFVVIPKEFICIRQAKAQYSHACYDWKKQRPVIEAFIRILHDDYPDAYPFFRRSGLLPTYDFQCLLLLLAKKRLRGYLTPLLAWRLLTYKPLRTIGRLLPDNARIKIRLWLRV